MSEELVDDWLGLSESECKDFGLIDLFPSENRGIHTVFTMNGEFKDNGIGLDSYSAEPTGSTDGSTYLEEQSQDWNYNEKTSTEIVCTVAAPCAQGVSVLKRSLQSHMNPELVNHSNDSISKSTNDRNYNEETSTESVFTVAAPCTQGVSLLERNLQSHMNPEPVNDSNDRISKSTKDETYECVLCFKTFKRILDLEKHFKNHRKVKRFKCHECDRAFVKLDTLNAHIRSHSGDRPYTCQFCDKSYTTKYNLDSHARVHTGVWEDKCDVCGKVFSCRGNLTKHMASHAGGCSFRCELCGKSFSRQKAFETHKRTHNVKRLYKCDLCDKEFPTNSELLVHKRCHSGKWPHTCDVCDAGFVTSLSLATHKRSHIFDEPIQCTECLKWFNSKYRLNAHLRIHKSAAKYNCEFCEKTFRYETCLVSHISDVHIQFACNVCFKAFPRLSDLVQTNSNDDGSPHYKCNECLQQFQSDQVQAAEEVQRAEHGLLRVHHEGQSAEENQRATNELLRAENGLLGVQDEGQSAEKDLKAEDEGQRAANGLLRVQDEGQRAADEIKICEEEVPFFDFSTFNLDSINLFDIDLTL